MNQFMKRFMFFSLISCFLLSQSNVVVAEGAIPVLLHIPIAISVDQQAVTNRWAVDVPIQKIEMDWSIFVEHAQAPDDQFVGHFLRAVHDRKLANLAEFFQINSSKLNQISTATYWGNFREMMFPEGGGLMIVGKVSEESGVAYIECRSSSEGVDFPILNLRRDAQGEWRIKNINDTLLDLAIDSLSVQSPDQLLAGVPGSAEATFDQAGLISSLEKESADPALINGIRRCLSLINSSGGKSGFTTHSRNIMAPTGISAPQLPNGFFSDYVQDAQRIAWVLNFDPVCVTIQKSGSARAFYYYVKSDGVYLNANAGSAGPIDDFLRSLPAPPPEILAKIQSTLTQSLKN